MITVREISWLPTFEDQGLKLDWESCEFSLQDVPFRLSPLEYKILGYLFRHSPKYMSRSEIVQAVWGDSYNPYIVKVYINTLRKKIGRDRISTLTCFGYRFNCALST